MQLVIGPVCPRAVGSLLRARKARRANCGVAASADGKAGEGSDSLFGANAGVSRQALFNDIAPVYDTLNDVLSLGQHRVWKARFAHECDSN